MSSHLCQAVPHPPPLPSLSPGPAGIGVTSTGHCHPAIVKAVQEQAATIVHAQQNIFGAHEKAVSGWGGGRKGGKGKRCMQEQAATIVYAQHNIFCAHEKAVSHTWLSPSTFSALHPPSLP